jgi:hypothetical protein
MQLTGLHLLLTYQCNYECDHCFVWGGPRQRGVMSVDNIRNFLRQARDLGTIEWVFFEGGEPFLYYPVLMRGVQLATSMGFRVGIVTNAYWATSLDDAVTWLKPFVDMVEDLSISCDEYHSCDENSALPQNASAAAAQLGIPAGVISIAPPENLLAEKTGGVLPDGESGVMFRGRAASRLAGKVKLRPWETFTGCLNEDLREPGRVHLDPFGNVHICQGVTLGNVFELPLTDIVAAYDPDSHPITGPLLRGGPVELVKTYHLPHETHYADACHLCYEARLALRDKFPSILGPDQVYGIIK